MVRLLLHRGVTYTSTSCGTFFFLRHCWTKHLLNTSQHCVAVGKCSTSFCHRCSQRTWANVAKPPLCLIYQRRVLPWRCHHLGLSEQSSGLRLIFLIFLISTVIFVQTHVIMKYPVKYRLKYPHWLVWNIPVGGFSPWQSVVVQAFHQAFAAQQLVFVQCAASAPGCPKNWLSCVEDGAIVPSPDPSDPTLKSPKDVDFFY